MTPKDKAQELVNKYSNQLEHIARIADEWSMSEFSQFRQIIAAKCALIAVNEIILSRKDDSQFDDTLWAGGSDMYTMHPMYLKYWQKVKQEIENL